MENAKQEALQRMKSISGHVKGIERMLENDGRVVSNFIVQALRGDELTIYGDGTQTRSFCYVSDLVEGLIDAGVRVGLARDVATTLTLQTVLGTARMMQSTGRHPALMKEMVTSPAGTTIAGVHALERGGLRATLIAS